MTGVWKVHKNDMSLNTLTINGLIDTIHTHLRLHHDRMILEVHIIECSYSLMDYRRPTNLRLVSTGRERRRTLKQNTHDVTLRLSSLSTDGSE